MSDLMLHGVLNMPLPDDPREMSALQWGQFRSRARQASAHIDAQDAKIKALVEAGEAVDAQSMRTYTAKNGKQCGIEADDGEACEIVHSDAMHHLRAALAAAKETTA